MSVDYNSCSVCGESHYEEYVGNCQQCGHSICVNCCINDRQEYDTYRMIYNFYGDTSDSEKEESPNGRILVEHCPYCNGEVEDPNGFVLWLCDKYQIDLSAEQELYVNRDV